MKYKKCLRLNKQTNRSSLVISLTTRTYNSARCRGQEEGKDALFRKRKVLQLVSHWSRLYKDFLKEEEHVRSFMKVPRSHLFLVIYLLSEPLFECRIAPLFLFSSLSSFKCGISSLELCIAGQKAFCEDSRRALHVFPDLFFIEMCLIFTQRDFLKKIVKKEKTVALYCILYLH